LEVGEIYDALTLCLMKAIQKYDPDYADKVKLVVKAVTPHTSGKEIFTAGDLHLDFDARKYLKLLARKGYLQAETDPDRPKRSLGFRRAAKNWPPPKKFLNSKPIGLPYHVQQWFRFYLQRHIYEQMEGLENRSDTMQLEHWRDARGMSVGFGNPHPDDQALPSSEGNLVAQNGKRFAADLDLAERDIDVGNLDLKWVAESADPLFANLSLAERRLL
jgi:hypothetical protein